VEIMELERVTAQHWRALEEEWLGGWLLRAADGFTGRANSALPLGDPGLPLDDALAAVTEWYRARGLPAMIAIAVPLGWAQVSAEGSALHQFDNYLSERNWLIRAGPAYVMTADLDCLADPPGLPGDLEFRADPEPDDAWLGMYHYRGQERQPPVLRSVLMSAPSQAFASIRSGDGPVAIGRLSIAGDWAGITAVEVHPGHRRRGLGTAITLSVCAEAARSGPRQVFLQAETDNASALSLYERCGFTYSHRYHYRVAPLGGTATRRGGGCFLGRQGSRYVCHHGYPCAQGLGSFARRDARRCPRRVLER
jgi:N-acetylglutamate synthase